MAFMDEHMVVEGGVEKVNADIKDENTKPLRWWTTKHNWYSDRELFEIFEKEKAAAQPGFLQPRLFGTAVERRRWMKARIYARIPLAWRSWLYYLFRYYLKLGFLDGPQGRIYHFLQAYWYRFLVDAKVFEARKYPKIKEKLIDEISKSLE